MKSFKQFVLEGMSREQLAKKLNIQVQELDELPESELAIVLKLVGRNDFKPDSDFDPKELAKGIKVEHEHTDYDIIAKLIAKDHLVELPDYYSRLEKMEND